MMSPLTVAQYLDGGAPSFDLVIFDEASQLPTEDAVGAVTRGRQLAVVGDPKQLPPTNFFSVSTGTVEAPLGDDGAPLYEDSESVLEEFMGAAVPMSRLKWHYRSAHESLISFSNVNFYDSDLHTFPSVVTDTDASGLQFHYVEDGVYEGKGLNLVEARRIADEVVSFAKLQLQRKSAGLRPLSLGVGTLNLRQQLGILDELESRRRDDPLIEPFFDRSGEEPFFVKNLENIQGDERDAIFLSITYGKSPDGRIRYNFGPLNRENGWRRLNVLVTRARRQMKVFSSMRDHDINPAGAVSDGPRLLREFLAYAEHRRLGGQTITAAAEAESPFEREVAVELMRRGVRVQPQVGVCGYRVDLGVLDSDVPGRFVCGIECDGVAYHSMETVRDRDRLRQQLLEDRGWIIHRVWSTDWFKDRRGQIERLLALIEQSREQVKNEEEQRAEERLRPDPVVAPTPGEIEGPRPGYSRPAIPEYEMFDGAGLRVHGELVEASAEVLADIVRRVVELEGPVHEADVIVRVCTIWGTRAGARIQDAIRAGCRLAERQRRVVKREPFYWRPDGGCRARSRAETSIPGDRIAPEEFAEAVRLILANGRAFPRAGLITEIRAVMGYSRTGAVLEQAIGNVVDGLVAAGVLGEGSTGLMLRESGSAEGV
jgi:very-short-patch-repair endonuclease